MSGVFNNIQLTANLTAEQIRSLGEEYLINKRQEQNNPRLTWAELIEQIKKEKKKRKDKLGSYVNYIPGLESIDPNIGRKALNNMPWQSSLAPPAPPVAQVAAPAPLAQNVDDNNNNKLPHQAAPAPLAQENNNNNLRFPSLQDFGLAEEQSMLKAPASEQTLRMANRTKTPFRGRTVGVAASSVSKSAYTPLGVGRNLQLEYDEQSTMSSIGSIQTETVEQQRENLMTADAIFQKHNIEGDVYEMAVDREEFLDSINRTWNGGVEGGDDRYSCVYTDSQRRFATKLYDRFLKRENDRKELVKTVDSEEAKHDESIVQTQEKLEESKTEIFRLKSEGEKLPTELMTQLDALKATYDQDVRDLEAAAEEKDTNIKRTLKTAEDLEEKLKVELASKQKIKREYVGVARKVSQLMSSAHNVVEIYKKASMAPKAQLASLAKKAQEFAKKHEDGQEEYAEMMKEFE